MVAILLHAACTVQDTGAPSLTGPSEASGALPPLVQTPTARFTFAPAVPAANSPVVFDGRLSCVGTADPAGTNPCPSTGGAITSYSWNFGDLTSATGPTASHVFDVQRTFNVTLTVTNDSGRSGSTTRPVTIGAGLAPSPAFVVSPTSAVVGQPVFVDAQTSVAGGGHAIASYAWNWGDGSSSTGVTASHAYAAAGTYVIGLVVTDEEGQTASTTRSVAVGTGAPTASFAFVPTTGHTIAFDASASAALGGATITNYAWSFGDTLSASGPAAAVTHTYAAANTFTVTLTVTDSLGRSGVIFQPVAVP